MDKAKEIYLVGKERIVSAAELNKIYLNTVTYKEKRFICTCCGEYVTYVRRTHYKSYFKHAKENELTKLCELKSSFNSQFSIYERAGLPLYIKRTMNNIYELYIGFYSVDEAKYNRLINEDGNVRIRSYNDIITQYCNFNLKEDTVSNTNIVLKKIDFISSKYSISYSTNSIEKLLSNIWGTEIDGIQSNGGIFCFGEYGGKKIRINEDITINTEYLYLGKSDRLFNYYKGIKSELVGSIFLNMNYGMSTYYIYKILISVNDENDFKVLSEFFRDKFKLSLIYKPAKLINIWPPAVVSNQGIKYVNNKEESLCILEDDEGNGSLYLHYSNDIDQINGEEIALNKYLVKVPIKNYKIPISINEKYSSIAMLSNSFIDNVKQSKNYISFSDKNNQDIPLGRKTQLPLKKVIKVKAKDRCKAIQVKKNNNYVVHKITSEKELYIDNVEFGDRILIRDSLKEISFLEYTRNYVLTNNVNDKKVFLRLSKLEENYIGCPVWIKKVLKMVRNYPKTYLVVHKYIVSNKIPIKALDILKEIYNER